MKKFFTMVLVITILCAAGVAIYLYNNKSDEIDQEPLLLINSDDEYVAALGNIMADYSDAYIQLALIFNTDPEQVPFETWQIWVDENIEKWKEIEKNAENIIKYLEKSEKIAYAQSFMPETIEFDPESVSLPQQEELQFTKPLIENEEEENIDEPTEVDIVDPSLNITYQVLQTSQEAPKGEKIVTLIQKFGFKDARTAASLLEKAQKLETKKWENMVEANNFLSEGATVIQNSSFTTVAALGIVVSGGQILTASTTGAKILAGVSTTFGGADLVLQTGETYNAIIDNRKGETHFKQARENLKPINDVIGFVNLKDGLKNGGNLVKIYGYGESISNFIEEVNSKDPSTQEEKQLFMTNFGDGNSEVSLGYDNNFTNPYNNSPEKLMADLEKLFPKDASVKINDSYIRVGDKNYAEKPIVEEPIEEEQENPSTPSTFSFSGGYSVLEPISGTTSIGEVTFAVLDNNAVSGSATLKLNDSVTRQGVTTKITGSGSASLTGSYDNSSTKIRMEGNYSSSSVSTTSGQSMKMSDSGTVIFAGEMVEFNVFSGTVTFTSNDGTILSTSWIAQKSN